ncbi:MAG TPA: hypothetical protein VKE98_17060 [Gemmataceae bacterium]|nr:hypothetical protein [Gemmataceae bacterium]
MKQFLLSVCVRGKKDLVLLRQRTRQLAALLGCDGTDQTILAATVFDLACQRHQRRPRATWSFWVADRRLRIAPDVWHSGPNLHIVKRLPERAILGDADIQWVIKEMGRLAPVKVFEEMQKLNQDLLQALLEARRVQRTGTIRTAA